MEDYFEICEFSETSLSNIISKHSLLAVDDIQKKIHFNYICEYLNHLSCKTALIEKAYVDLDYLDDYVEYYAKCFYPYERFCKRIHFFSSNFTTDEYIELIKNNKKETKDFLQKNYLGFIVLKPLPNRIFGRTCLITYPEKSTRFYGSIRNYEVHLHGFDLKIDSLAYQEQDGVVSACATTALWSAFHGTGKKFHHPIPTPIKITKSAIENMPIRERSIPSIGLRLEELVKAINHIGLEAEKFNVYNNPVLFKAIIYAYTGFGLPIVMVGELIDTLKNNLLGLHAVTICGFNLGNINYSEFPLVLKSQEINKIYLHDDQIGPFSRCEIINNEIHLPGSKEISNHNLTTSWIDDNGVKGNVFYIPEYLILPIYHKIRIRIDSIINKINQHLVILGNSSKFNVEDWLRILIWDIKLYDVANFKKELHDLNFISEDEKISLLTRNLPKFLWIAKSYENNILYSMLIFDATDIKDHDFLIDSIYFKYVS